MALTLSLFFLYFAVVIGIGLISSRRESEDGFMIADRRVAGGQLAATMSAGFFDGATLAIYVAYIYQFGLSALWLFIGLALGFVLLRQLAPRIKEKADELKVYAMPEYFLHVIGKRSALLYSTIITVVLFLLLTVNLIVSGKVLSAMFPLPYPLSVAIGGCIIVTYLLLAGFKAVVRTDVFQLLTVAVMSVAVAIYLLGRVSIPSTELRLFGSMDMGTMVGFLVIGVFVIMVSPDLWQRLFAARDVTTAKRGLSFAALILLLLSLILSVVGLATKQFFPDILPEDALVTGFTQLLPLGLKEFGMVLLYAVSLSSADTFTFVLSSIFTRDLQNYTQKYSALSMRTLTRVFIALFVMAAVSVGIFYQNIILLGFSLASLTLALFPPTFGSLFWKLNDRAVSWSLVCACLSVIGLLVTGTLTPATSIISLPVSFIFLFAFSLVFKGR